MLEIPNENGDVVEVVKIDEAVMVLLAVFPVQEILALTKEERLVQAMLVVMG